VRTEKQQNQPLQILLTFIILVSERTAAASHAACAGNVEAATQGKAQNPESGTVTGYLSQKPELLTAAGMAAKQLTGQGGGSLYPEIQPAGVAREPAGKPLFGRGCQKVPRVRVQAQKNVHRQSLLRLYLYNTKRHSVLREWNYV